MQLISFKKMSIFLTFLFTFLLFLSISSLILVPKFDDVLSSIFNPEMIYSLKVSLYSSLISTGIVLGFSIPTGYAISRYSFPGKSIVKAILDLPIAFPELVLGLALLLLFGQTFIGDILEFFGIKVVFTKLGIVVAQIFTALPYAIRIVCSTFQDINPRYELVSRSLGYSEFETFKNVTLPMARSGIFASSIIAFARCMGTFGTVLMFAGGTYMYTETLPITLYLNMSYGNLGMAISSGIVLLMISFIAILIFEKYEGGKF